MSSSKIQERNLDPNMGLAKEESVQEILNKVENNDVNRYVKASDNVILTIASTSTVYDEYQEGSGSLYKFRAIGINGTFKVRCSINSSKNTSNAGFHFYINGNLDCSLTTTSTSFTTLEGDISIADGDYIEIKGFNQYDGQSLTYNLLTICGDFVTNKDFQPTLVALD